MFEYQDIETNEAKSSQNSKCADNEAYQMPFIIFQTKDNNQCIQLMYDDVADKQNLFIGTQQEFEVTCDIDLFLETCNHGTSTNDASQSNFFNSMS